MAQAMTTGSSITCPDNGSFTLTSGAKLKVNGKAVLKASDSSTWQATGCTQTDASSSQVQCLKIAALTSGQLTKLKLGGSAALGSDTAGTTNGSPKNTLSADAKQSKLTAK
jgi:hypothetical protein